MIAVARKFPCANGCAGLRFVATALSAVVMFGCAGPPPAVDPGWPDVAGEWSAAIERQPDAGAANMVKSSEDTDLAELTLMTNALADSPEVVVAAPSAWFSLETATLSSVGPSPLGEWGPRPQESDPPAEPASGDAEDLAKKLQNPIADLISLPFQFNWDTGIGPKDSDKLLVNVQPVIPISLSEDWNVISRTIVPVVYAESPADGISSEFGMGDITQSFFFSPKKPVGGWILGAGPVFQIPTGTDDLFRSKKFSIGPTGIALQQTGGWTYGALVNHLWSVAGDDDYRDVNATFLQPFVAHTWKSGTTLSLNSESTYNWTAEEWTVPLNLMIAQLVHLGSQPIQFQIGGRWYADKPDGGPEWGLRFSITFLFPK